MSQSIDWSDVIKKEARGTGDTDLGEVQEVGKHYIMTQKGIVNKEKFYVPKYMVEGYDGETLWFNVTDEQFRGFMRDAPPEYDEYARYRTPDMATDIETRIPVIEERLDVSKRVSTTEATIVKEPMTETRTVEVPVTHEELRVDRRATTETRETDKPVQTRTEVKVPLTHEEVEVTKKPYVKEEVVVTKEPVTETQTVTDTVTSERVDVESRAEKIKKGSRAA
jgi:uncharacterized protein (TIGR02271 family)